AIDRLVRTHKLYFKGTGNREQGTEKCPNSFGDCYKCLHDGIGSSFIRNPWNLYVTKWRTYRH
ncbi:hypothetical protein, partial [Crocosphaera sp.]|uniref:hypothetical protein n=1 Tax=Crocosphaera sp. TaxID=2729996 RepID=UPI00260D629E